MNGMKLIECPRDAMQGIDEFINTDDKVLYINQLLKCGFNTLDVGSFVSPKAIPQMADTAKVLESIDESKTELLVIVANERGARDAVTFDRVKYVGFPFSISEEFQKRNTNSTIEESLSRVEAIQKLCQAHGKTLVVYISMGFGNPYGEPWHPDLATSWSERLAKELEVKIISLSDTIGVSTPEVITDLFTTIIPELSDVEIGAHLHTTPDTWKEKVDAAYNSDCRRMDGALRGYGGCPMAMDKLTGNMPMEHIISYLKENDIESGIESGALLEALRLSNDIMPS
jgi:hydroxymethylglutaryl-CoA lyase